MSKGLFVSDEAEGKKDNMFHSTKKHLHQAKSARAAVLSLTAWNGAFPTQSRLKSSLRKVRPGRMTDAA